MIEWLVVADDLSGAAELGAAAARRGLATALTTGSAPEPGAAVCVVDTGTRDLPAAEAEDRLRAFAPAIAAIPARRVFKKIDSVLRGRPGAESGWLAQVRRLEGMVVVPGNPERGRLVRAGRLWVDGMKLEDSVLGRDPLFPAATSEVAALWARSGGMPVRVVLADEVDAQTLPGWAARVDAGVLAVGALEFFEACLGPGRMGAASVVPRTSTVWVVCGSQAGWPERARHFRARGWCVLDDSARLDPAPSGCTLWGIGDSPRADPRQALRSLVGRVAAAARAGGGPGLWCLEGGATAAALRAAMGWSACAIAGEAAPGTALLHPAGGAGAVLIKPGSYAWPASVVEAWEAAGGGR